MNRHRAWSAAATLWISAAALSGCGGASVAQAPVAPEPAGATSMAPHKGSAVETADDALAELERAEDELDQAIGTPAHDEGRAVAEAAQPGAPPAASPPSPSVPDSRAAPSPRATAAGGEPPAKKIEAEPTSTPPCETACRALASMSRAAQHLCGLAGDADQRCDSARARVKSATDRVEARCPRCAEL
ncbi:hypothetical protein WMF45_21285 [Sorangium sp. So ce448]|uniref:hypothetical protein n=1 Tax=Sorangium sp. So ce448 TaxID=3133314 RepID=UPI003F5FF644